MRVGFVTCVRLGLSCMEAIYEVGGSLHFAMTLQDELAPEKSGRVRLDAFCTDRSIPLHKIKSINDHEAVGAIAAAHLDWLFIVGWSQIAHAAVLRATRMGVLGMHPTLLPVGRGRAPIPWAILLGLPETGVTLFKLDEGVDTGPVIAQTRIRVEARETADTLYSKINIAHAALLKDHWPAFASGQLAPAPQDHARATVWRGRKPEDGRLLESATVAQADRLIRAVTHPYPGAFIDTAEGRLRIWASGAPGDDCGGGEPGAKARRLRFSDGWLDALDWVMETPVENGVG